MTHPFVTPTTRCDELDPHLAGFFFVGFFFVGFAAVRLAVGRGLAAAFRFWGGGAAFRFCGGVFFFGLVAAQSDG